MRALRAIATFPSQFHLLPCNDAEGVKQEQRLVEDGAAIGIDISSGSTVALVVEPKECPMLIGYAPLGVFWEVADAWDFPALRPGFAVERAWLVRDGDGDSEFFSSSSTR